jgi:integration host factor subunit beta
MKYTRSRIRSILQAGGMDPEKARAVTNQIITSMAAALAAGEVIELRGLGTLEPRERKARIRHNPRTMDPVHIPARRVIFFKPSGKVKKAINTVDIT